MHLWVKYTKIQATYETDPTNDVARTAVLRHCRTMMMTQDDDANDATADYIYWVSHLAKSIKQYKKNIHGTCTDLAKIICSYKTAIIENRKYKINFN